MEFITYLYPSETVAQAVILVQVGGFILWVSALIYLFVRDTRLRRSILDIEIAESETESTHASEDREDSFLDVPNRSLRHHLNALTSAGENGRSIDVQALTRSTTAALGLNNGWLKSTLSLFIIVGLLGTLWGLASSLDQLSRMTPDGSSMTSESLALGLNVLLSKLGGAFAPSIYGVGFTIIGVLLFALYSRVANLPLLHLVERQTIAFWAPALTEPEANASLLMRGNLQAAEGIGKAAESISANVDKLATIFVQHLPNLVENLSESVGQITDKLSLEAANLSNDVNGASAALQTLTIASENLGQFSETFKATVEKLYPFSDAAELRSLYEKLLDRSTVIADEHASLQLLLSEQLNQNSNQTSLLDEGFKALKEDMRQSSAAIVSELGGTAAAAKDAFGGLSQQNENVIRELVRQVGLPISDVLTPLPDTFEKLNREIERINAPLESVKNSIAETSFNVINHANDSMVRIGDKLQAQVVNLETLSSSIDSLVPKLEVLSERIENFNAKTETLRSSIDKFGEDGEAVARKLVRFDQKADEVLRATRVKPQVGGGSTPGPQKKRGFFAGIKNKVFGD